MGVKNDYEQLEIESAAELRAWLAANHGQREGVWVVRFKQHVAGKHVSWDEIVDEALCWGWIDSLARRLDDERTMQVLTPRREGSGWSALNKRRVERLTAEGRMMAPGMEAIERAKADGSWTVYDEVEALVIPEDLAAALAENGEARRYFEAFSSSAKKGILWWIKSAKRRDTREKRIAETARLAARNLRANHPEARDFEG